MIDGKYNIFLLLGPPLMPEISDYSRIHIGTIHIRQSELVTIIART